MSRMIHSILCSLFCLTLAGCSQTFFKDPEYGTWEYNTQNEHPNLVYTNMSGEKIDGLYATTGFFGDAAIVAKCTKFDSQNKCRKIQYGILTDDGELASTFGMFEYPEVALHEVEPPNLRYNGNKTMWLNFPMWEGVDHKTEQKTIWDYAEDGLILIKSNDRFGFADLKGNVIVDPKYLAASSFKDNAAIVVNEDFVLGTINAQGVFTPENYACMNQRNNGMTYAYTKGKLADYRTDLRFDNHLIFVSDTLEKRANDPNYRDYMCTNFESTMGLLDNNLREIIPNKFVKLYPLSNQHILVKTSDNLWGYYDAKGKVIIPPKYKNLKVSQHGMVAMSQENELWAVCKNKDCSLNTGFIYANIGYYFYDDNEGQIILTSEYLLAQKNETGKWGVVSMDGVETTPFIYDELTYISYTGDTMISKIGDKMGLIRNGVELYPPKFISIGKFDDEGKALARTPFQETYIYLNKDPEERSWHDHARSPHHGKRNER